MNERWRNVVVGGLVAGSAVVPGFSRAEEGGTLQERFERLEQRTGILERKAENNQEAAAAAAKGAASVTANAKDGFSLKSPDGSFKLRIVGYMHVDGRFYLKDDAVAAADQFLVRRARSVFEGTAGKNTDFRLLVDFGGGTLTLLDAYVNLSHAAPFQVRVGKFKAPFGLERLQSILAASFVELAHPTSLAPNRDVGVQVHGDLREGAISYAAGYFNGTADGGSVDTDVNDGKDLVARVFAHPFKSGGSLTWKDLGVGFAGSRGRALGTSSTTVTGLSFYRTPGQQTFFSYRSDVVADGDRVRWSPQAYWYSGRLGFLGEYVASRQDVKRVSTGARETLTNRAWQTLLSCSLTGENASFKGLKPRQDLDLAKGTWGAWELVGRYTQFTADRASFPLFADGAARAQRARTGSGGLNWYVNANVKVQADYDDTRFTGGAPGANARKLTERAVLTRFQVVF